MWTQAYVEPNSNPLGETMNPETLMTQESKSNLNLLTDCTPRALDIIACEVLQHFGKVVRLSQGHMAVVDGLFYNEQHVKLTLARSDWHKLPDLLKARFADVFSGKHLEKGVRLTYRDSYLFDVPDEKVFVNMVVGFPNKP